MSDNGALLEVRDLKTYFYRRGRFGVIRRDDYVPAVDGVSFTVQAAETLGIVGESGCGKTTLGRTILRLTPATSGSVLYEGEELLELTSSAMRDKRREMQMIFQDLDAALNPKMKVKELLAEAITLHENYPSRRCASAARSFCLSSSSSPRSSPPCRPISPAGRNEGSPSPGVLALSPWLIVADEPLSALDVSIAPRWRT